MPESSHRFFGSGVHGAILFASLLLHFCLAYCIDRSDSPAVIGLFGLLGLLFLIQWADQKIGVKQIVALGLLLRLVYLIAVPELSDDVFRYVWDGMQSANGISPYEFTPAEWLRQSDSTASQQLYPLLNSQGYHSIYPPVLQFFFASASWLAQGNMLAAIIILRVFVLLAELGSMMLIWRLLKVWGMNPRNMMLYAFNPLVIVEFSGNLHGEVFMVFFLLLSLMLLAGSRHWLSAVAFSLSVGAKLLPLMFLPFLVRRLGLWRTAVYGAVIGASVMLMYLPFRSDGLLPHTLDTLRLYFASFEFNASVYYVVREIGFAFMGYNIIGSTALWLPRIVLASILILALLNRERRLSALPKLMMFAWFIYYALSTTVNPWYAAVLAMFLPFVEYRFALLWLMLIPLSYHAFGHDDYRESLWVVSLEYVPVYLWLLFELGGMRPLQRKWALHRAEVKRKRLIPYLGKGRNVLEAGAGNGALTALLRNEGIQVEPLDIDDRGIFPNVNITVYDGKNFPYGDRQFDVCQLITMLHHTADAEQIVREAKRVAERIIIMEDIYGNPFRRYVTWFADSLVNWEFYGHPHTNRTDAGWKALFEANGLRLVHVEYHRFLFLFRQVTYVLK